MGHVLTRGCTELRNGNKQLRTMAQVIEIKTVRGMEMMFRGKIGNQVFQVRITSSFGSTEKRKKEENCIFWKIFSLRKEHQSRFYYYLCTVFRERGGVLGTF